MIEEILPAEVAAVEAFADPPDGALFPVEEAAIARAVAKRRLEFTTVRGCARAALAALGVPPVPIVPGPDRAPQWPDGIVGSLTHCDGYRAAAVAHARDIVTIGIDAEPHEPLPPGVADIVMTPDELESVPPVSPAVCWDRLLFCAKEAVYKAWYPLALQWLGFTDAVVTFGVGSFAARLLIPGPVSGFEGRWLVRDNLVLTAVVVPR